MYLDDVLIYSPSVKQHLKDVENVLEAFKKAELLLHPTKCKFALNQAEFLGFTFTPDGLLPSAKHTAAVSQYKAPKTVKEVCTFLGLVNYFKRHIPDRATLLQPLTDLTRKDKAFEWTEECQESFEKAK